MASLIIQDSFEPYYAGRRKWVSPSRAAKEQNDRSARAQESAERSETRASDDCPEDEARH